MDTPRDDDSLLKREGSLEDDYTQALASLEHHPEFSSVLVEIHDNLQSLDKGLVVPYDPGDGRWNL